LPHQKEGKATYGNPFVGSSKPEANRRERRYRNPYSREIPICEVCVDHIYGRYVSRSRGAANGSFGGRLEDLVTYKNIDFRGFGFLAFDKRAFNRKLRSICKKSSGWSFPIQPQLAQFPFVSA
jgi:hypothetical protein